MIYLPFQSQLYKQDQPTLYLLDFGDEVFLWHGWWPLGYKEEGNVSTGSARARFTEDRKLALETAINYCKGWYIIVLIFFLMLKMLSFFSLCHISVLSYTSPFFLQHTILQRLLMVPNHCELVRNKYCQCYGSLKSCKGFLLNPQTMFY